MLDTEEKRGPRFVSYFRPVIDALKALGGSGQPSEVKDFIIESLKLSDEEISATIKIGGTRFSNAVDWARFYLAKAGYIDSSKRGVWSLTDEGLAYSLTHDEAVDLFSSIHKEYTDKRRKPLEDGKTDDVEDTLDDEIPDELFDHRSELMNIIQSLPPSGFERLCQRLLRESGFERVAVTGRSGDGGLDGLGILQVNPLVSFKVLFQSKRYSGSVGPDKVRDFRGAMQGRADKGIILTTGTFTQAAREESVRDGVPPIELVNGEKLLDMLEELQLGVTPRITYDIDTDFFDAFTK
jgi:restriction system protein